MATNPVSFNLLPNLSRRYFGLPDDSSGQPSSDSRLLPLPTGPSGTFGNSDPRLLPLPTDRGEGLNSAGMITPPDGAALGTALRYSGLPLSTGGLLPGSSSGQPNFFGSSDSPQLPVLTDRGEGLNGAGMITPPDGAALGTALRYSGLPLSTGGLLPGSNGQPNFFGSSDSHLLPLNGPGSTTPNGQADVASASSALTPTPASQPAQLGTTAGDSAELGRVIRSGSGVSQILHQVDDQGNPTGQHNGFLRTLGGVAARVGDVAGSILAPRVMSMIPGTTLHHDALIRQDTGILQNDEANDQKAALTSNLNDASAFKQQGLDLQQTKLDATIQHQQDVAAATAAQKAATYRANLAAHGYAPDEKDPTGVAVRPLRYEEMSQQQQAVHDLKGAQEEQADAQAALKRAANDPTAPAYRLAQARVAVAQSNAATARGRLGLSSEQFEMRAHGTQDGVPLPGSLQDDAGNTIGTAFQQNVRPTGQERNKADMANSAADQITAMRTILHNRPDIFGPVAGRTTDFNVWLGSQDPDAQRFRAARTIAGDHLAGTFGGRSEAALSALDNAIGQFKDNPAAVDASLDQLSRANARFQQAGTMHTTGSHEAFAPETRTYQGHTYVKGGNGQWALQQ